MLGALEGMGRTLPNPTLLVMPYARREAVLSSRIEGTQASLSDLFLFEAAKVKSENSDVKEVANYVRAMNHGLKRLHELPLSLRLVREMHAKLLEGVRVVRGAIQRIDDPFPSAGLSDIRFARLFGQN